MTRRTERVGDLLLETLSELLLRDVKDPRIGTVTLTGVTVDDDLRRVRVRWTLLGGRGERGDAQRGLESASRFMQGKAARLLHMKFTPELHFEYDEGFDHADQIGRLLREIKKD